MDYTVERLEGFQVIGFSREFRFDASHREIPEFWDEILEKFCKPNLLAGKAPVSEVERAIYDNHIGDFGICVDDIGKDGRFRYMIAGRYTGGGVPEGMELFDIPAALWARFKCAGALPAAIQAVNAQIWNEWLPGNSEYELDGGINIEWYSDSEDTHSADYRSEIWLPVKARE